MFVFPCDFFISIILFLQIQHGSRNAPLPQTQPPSPVPALKPVVVSAGPQGPTSVARSARRHPQRHQEQLGRRASAGNAVTRPRAVQSEVIPAILEGVAHGLLAGRGGYRPRDVCVSAPTGSGKTLAFVVPIVQVREADGVSGRRWRHRGWVRGRPPGPEVQGPLGGQRNPRCLQALHFKPDLQCPINLFIYSVMVLYASCVSLF